MPGNHHALKVISSPQTRFHRALNKDQRYYVEFISGPSILSFSFSLISYIPMTRKLNMIPKCIYQSLTSPQRNLGIFLFLPPIHPLLSHLPPIIREWCAKSLPILPVIPRLPSWPQSKLSLELSKISESFSDDHSVLYSLFQLTVHKAVRMIILKT